MGHDEDEFMRLLHIGTRITEVLAKYNISLPNAPKEALAMAMDRMITNRSRVVSALSAHETKEG